MRISVDVSDLTAKRVLLTLGASLVGDRLECSNVHTSTYQPQESARVEQVTRSGSPEELARIAAAWFGEVLRRPVMKKAGGHGWSFVPHGTTLPEGYRWVRNAPSGEAASG